MTEPPNSRALYRAPSTPMVLMSSSIRSLPRSHLDIWPLMFTRMVGGTLIQVSPRAMPAAMSVEPMPVAKAPMPP